MIRAFRRCNRHHMQRTVDRSHSVGWRGPRSQSSDGLPVDPAARPCPLQQLGSWRRFATARCPVLPVVRFGGPCLATPISHQCRTTARSWSVKILGWTKPVSNCTPMMLGSCMRGAPDQPADGAQTHLSRRLLPRPLPSRSRHLSWALRSIPPQSLPSGVPADTNRGTWQRLSRGPVSLERYPAGYRAPVACSGVSLVPLPPPRGLRQELWLPTLSAWMVAATAATMVWRPLDGWLP